MRHLIDDVDLDVHESVEDMAHELYDICEVCDLVRGRDGRTVAAACLYLAIREWGEPVSVKDIHEATEIDTDEIHRVYSDICDELDISIDPVKPTDLVPTYLKRMNEEHDARLGEETLREAESLCATVNNRAPTTIAAAALYYASQIQNKRVIQQNVSEVSGVSTEAIRETYKEMRDERQVL